MIQMFSAGGLNVWTDGERTPDDSNRHGDYELERVRKLQTDTSWLNEAKGKVIKVVTPLVPFLPQECPYRIVFMERDLEEIVASQAKMLDRVGHNGGKLGHEQLMQALSRQIQAARSLIQGHQVPVLSVPFPDVLDSPAAVALRVAEFLHEGLDVQAMRCIVKPALHRDRRNGAEK